jgi:succinoglycan biosynthesis transport protein ExoP
MMGTVTSDSGKVPVRSGVRSLLDQRIHVDISDYWWILRRRKALVVTVFFVLLTLILLYSKTREPVYQSACDIRISARQPMAIIQGAHIAFFGQGDSAMDTEMELISSDIGMLNKTLINLREKTKGSSELSQPVIDFIDAMTPNELSGHITATRKKVGTQLVTIRVKGPDSGFTKIVANTLADTYQKSFADNKTNDALETKEFIEQLLESHNAELREIKDKIRDQSALLAELGSTETLKNQLSVQRAELTKAEIRYTQKHRVVIDLKAQIAQIEERLRAHPPPQLELAALMRQQEMMTSLSETIFTQVVTARIDYERKRSSALEEIQTIKPATLGYKQSPNIRMNAVIGVIFSLLLASIAAFVWEGMDTSIGKIEDVEQLTNLPVVAHVPIIGEVSKTPIYKFWRWQWEDVRNAALAMAVKCGFSFASQWKRQDVRPAALSRVLFNFDQKSVPAEAYRSLRTNIDFAMRGLEKHKILAITSSSPREGKTLTSANLAIAVAHMGKSVLVIGADLRRTELSNLFRIEAQPGLSDLLLGAVTEDEAIRTVTDLLVSDTEWDKIMNFQGIDNLHILTAGEPPSNPAELVGSDVFRELLDGFRERYDYIILDTPPVLPVTDASIIASIVDATLLIYQSNKTSRHLLLRAIQTLEKNHANLIGIVINQLSFDVTMPRSGKYGSYQGYGYY